MPPKRTKDYPIFEYFIEILTSLNNGGGQWSVQLKEAKENDIKISKQYKTPTYLYKTNFKAKNQEDIFRIYEEEIMKIGCNIAINIHFISGVQVGKTNVLLASVVENLKNIFDKYYAHRFPLTQGPEASQRFAKDLKERIKQYLVYELFDIYWSKGVMSEQCCANGNIVRNEKQPQPIETNDINAIYLKIFPTITDEKQREWFLNHDFAPDMILAVMQHEKVNETEAAARAVRTTEAQYQAYAKLVGDDGYQIGNIEIIKQLTDHQLRGVSLGLSIEQVGQEGYNKLVADALEILCSRKDADINHCLVQAKCFSKQPFRVRGLGLGITTEEALSEKFTGDVFNSLESAVAKQKKSPSLPAKSASALLQEIYEKPECTAINVTVGTNGAYKGREGTEAGTVVP